MVWFSPVKATHFIPPIYILYSFRNDMLYFLFPYSYVYCHGMSVRQVSSCSISYIITAINSCSLISLSSFSLDVNKTEKCSSGIVKPSIVKTLKVADLPLALETPLKNKQQKKLNININYTLKKNLFMWSIL